MWRIVRLTDSILQLAVTGKGAAYDDNVLGELENTLKLAQIVQHAGNVAMCRCVNTDKQEYMSETLACRAGRLVGGGSHALVDAAETWVHRSGNE